MKIVETNTGRNIIEDIDNEKELLIQRILINPRTDYEEIYEFHFQRGEEYAKLTITRTEYGEKISWTQYMDAKEYDALIQQAKKIASTQNPIDKEAKISHFASYVFDKYYKPDP